MSATPEQTRVIWLEAEISGDLVEAIGAALESYAPDAVLHVSHSMARKPSPSISPGAGGGRSIYSVLILVREPVSSEG